MSRPPLYPVESLIDHYRRLARRAIRTAEYVRWELRQPWVYVRSYVRADAFEALEAAGEYRRILAALLRHLRAGERYLRHEQVQAIKAAAVL